MSSCAHEHHHHHHGHSHDDAEHVKQGEGQQDLLFAAVDRDGVSALNAKDERAAAAIIRPYDQRMDETQALESDVDDELLIRISFVGSVRLRALLVRTGPDAMTPLAIHIYKNIETLDFDDAANETPKPTQKLESIPTTSDVVELPLLAARFSDVQTLTLYIPGSLGGERHAVDPHTRFTFLGFRGEARMLQRKGPATIVYEAAPRATDHTRVAGTASGTHPTQ